MASTILPDPNDTSTHLAPIKIVGEVKEIIRDENSVITGPCQEGYVRCTFKARVKRSWQERVMGDADHPKG